MPPEQPARCGFRLDIGLADESLSSDPCERPVWEDRDRCVWHADIDGKTVDMLETLPPEPGESLDGAHLKGASIVAVDWLAGTSLVGVNFAGAHLNGADLSNADLTLATLADVNAINVDFSGANLEGATFTNADLRRATLEEARIDEAVFTDVHVGTGTRFGERSVYDRDSVRPSLSGNHPLEAAAWAYRQLQHIYQENAFPRLARRSYTQEKDVRRRLAWDQRDWVRAIKWEVSRWVMLYGSSPYRILVVSLLVIVAAALLFPFTGGIQETRGEEFITYTIEDPETASRWWIGRVLFRSFYFSVVTFATLGYGDIRPIGTAARMLASIETIVGTLLTALLVFVLARSVTW